MEPTDLSGAVLDGRYKVIEPISEGAMGVVYRAERLKLGRIVAIKVLHDELPAELSSRKRFEIEAMAMAKLEHPHCAAVIDVGVHNDKPFVVMDFVSGDNLQTVIAAGPVPIPRAVEIVRQVLSGLAHAHEHGIIHRDIKPANIVLSQKSGLGDHVKILDFGLARFDNTSQNITTGIVVGTPSYMSPEQIRGVLIDHRSDIYACGVLLYELLTGHKPFVSLKDDPVEVCSFHLKQPPPTLASKQPGISFDTLEDIVARALAKKPEDRFPNAVEFATALDTVSTRRSQPIAAPLRVSGTAIASETGWTVPTDARSSVVPVSGVPAATSVPPSAPVAIPSEPIGSPSAPVASDDAPAPAADPSPATPAAPARRSAPAPFGRRVATPVSGTPNTPPLYVQTAPVAVRNESVATPVSGTPNPPPLYVQTAPVAVRNEPASAPVAVPSAPVAPSAATPSAPVAMPSAPVALYGAAPSAPNAGAPSAPVAMPSAPVAPSAAAPVAIPSAPVALYGAAPSAPNAGAPSAPIAQPHAIAPSAAIAQPHSSVGSSPDPSELAISAALSASANPQLAGAARPGGLPTDFDLSIAIPREAMGKASPKGLSPGFDLSLAIPQAPESPILERSGKAVAADPNASDGSGPNPSTGAAIAAASGSSAATESSMASSAGSASSAATESSTASSTASSAATERAPAAPTVLGLAVAEKQGDTIPAGPPPMAAKPTDETLLEVAAHRASVAAKAETRSENTAKGATVAFLGAAPAGPSPLAAPDAPAVEPVNLPTAPATPQFSKKQIQIGVGVALGLVLLIAIIASIAKCGGGKATQPAAATIDAAAASPVVGTAGDEQVVKANELIAAGRIDAALDQILAARKVFPKDPRLAYLAGKIYFEKQWWSVGLKQFRDALAGDATYRKDPELIKIVLKAFITPAEYHADLGAFLRNEIGEPARSYLQETATTHPRAATRARAKAELDRMR